MIILDGSNSSLDFENIVDRIFEVFDEVVFIDNEINKIYEIKSDVKFDLLGKSDDAAETIKQFKNSVFPEDRKNIEAFNPFADKLYASEIRCKNDAGCYRWCYLNMVPVNSYSFFVMIIDLDKSVNEGIKAKNEYFQKQIAADYKLQVLKQKYMAVLNHVQAMAIEIDLKEKIISINSNLENKFLFGTNYCNTIEEFKKTDLMHENDKVLFYSVPKKLEYLRYTSVNIRMKSIDGHFFTCLMHLYGVYDSDGLLHSIVGSAIEISHDENEANAECAEIVKDSWTGLMNGKCFCDSLEKTLKNSNSEKYALIVFDIEHFKYVNEVYGIEFGNDVVKFIGLNLREMFENTKNMTVRFLNDYFGIFLEYSNSDDIKRIIKEIDLKITYYNDIKLKYAYGIYEIKDKLLPARLICDYANMARKSVKGNYLNHIAFYSEDMKKRIIEDINIENDMEKALYEHQFLMYLQPKYNIRTAKIVGAEALVRWEHPSKGIIGPNMFIPLFEKNGFIMQLDMFIWEEACRVIKKWADAGKDPIPVSVNVSRINVSNPALVDVLDSLIEKYGIEKKYLELEITETVYYDDQISLINALSKLKQSGYTLLMDDFGSGFSSLSMLENTPFDVLKIDRSFFNEKMITDKGKKIIRYTIRLSNDIGLNIVAEGVETKEQADYLLQCGCCVAQGYYYSKPVTIKEFEKIIGYAD